MSLKKASLSRRPSHPNRVLRDKVRAPVRVLFVGINPGVRSAAIGHHFAGYSNRFWKLLFEAGVVPEPIGPEEDDRLPEWGFGVTNLIRRSTPGIDTLTPHEYVEGERTLRRKVRRWKPEFVVFVGVTLYRAIFDRRRAKAEKGTGVFFATVEKGSGKKGTGVDSGEENQPGKGPAGSSGPPAKMTPVPFSRCGLQAERFEGAKVFVLPNPSGRNAHFSYAEMLGAFRLLARALRR
jgi:TDG/mug DNA glycosylase family protein